MVFIINLFAKTTTFHLCYNMIAAYVLKGMWCISSRLAIRQRRRRFHRGQIERAYPRRNIRESDAAIGVNLNEYEIQWR
jgi:hypothetical protein